MIGLRQFLFYAIALFFIVFSLSCAEETGTDDANGEEFVEEGMNGDEVIEDKVYYQVPTPHEMMEFIKLSGSDFHDEVLCNTEIHDRFVDLKGNSMAMGIYIADLAYTASFEKFDHSIKYFNVVTKMADEIGIGNVFDEQMLTRIRENLDHPDSLEKISNDSYYRIIRDLEASDRGKVVAMIAAGGFLESLFIATQLVDEFDEKDPLIKRIADQKLVFENIMAYLNQYKDDQNVEWTINDLQALEGIFLEISDNSRQTKIATNEKGKKVLGGIGGVYITEQEFLELRYQVAFLRNTITFNPPNPPEHEY